MANFSVSRHDSYPEKESQIVDIRLGEFNDLAAPLHEVKPLSCFAHDESGRLVGGAVGRCWGQLCELQQLWVDETIRRQGLGAALVKEFEAHAMERGCTMVYLETFNFQAPGFYEHLGYRVEFIRRGFPHGIAKFHMIKEMAGII